MRIQIGTEQINAVIRVFKDNEDLLSDGYGYYCETVDKTLEKIAIEIIENLNKVIQKE